MRELGCMALGTALALTCAGAKAADVKFSELFKSAAPVGNTYAIQAENRDVLVFDGGGGAVVVLDGQQLIVNARQARLDNTFVIRSFTEDSTGPNAGGTGPAGDNRTKVGRCGQNGCTGTTGGTAPEAGQGGNGAPSMDIRLNIGSLSGTGMLVVLNNGQKGGRGQQAGRGGVGGDGGDGQDRACGFAVPGIGGQGGLGGTGGTGGPGGPGGPAGNIYFSVGLLPAVHAGTVKFTASGGLGGDGGNPGGGGPSGTGGRGGHGARCFPFPDGGARGGYAADKPTGPDGKHGRTGKPGADGKVLCDACLASAPVEQQ